MQITTLLQPLSLLERKTLLKRRSAGSEAVLQLLAANIDTLFVVTSCNEEFNLNRIERYLVLAAEAGIDAVVVLTKRPVHGYCRLRGYCAQRLPRPTD